jgi:hypothetical protein
VAFFLKIAKEMSMDRFKMGLVAMFLFLGQTGFAADDITDDESLTAEQKKQLQKVQASFAVVGKDTKQTKQEKQSAVSDALRAVLVQQSQPSDQSIDGLATTMSGQIADGKMSIQETMLVTKKLMQFLNQGDFSIDSNRALVRDISGLVQGSNLGPEGRNQFYNDILTVVSTADGNKRKGK